MIFRVLGRRKFFDFMVDKFWEMNVNGINFSYEIFMIVMDSFVRVCYIFRVVEMFGELGGFGIDCDIEVFNVFL